MKKPADYKLKKWLCNNTVVSLKVIHYQTGNDTSSTDWELESRSGEKVRHRDGTIKPLIDLSPDWVRVLQVRESVRKEVIEWDEYADKEADDLAEYERLKAKFEHTT